MKKMTLSGLSAFLISFLSLTGCSYAANTAATAVIQPTSDASKVQGKADLETTEQGIHVVAELSNLTPGLHGFHIHEKGDCGDTGKAAGPHFNPDAAPHGYLAKDGFTHAHAGDFGNIEADQDGNARFEGMIPSLNLIEGDKYSVLGRAFIVHEKADDFSQPAGNAGGRVACGIIEAKK